MNRAIRAHIRPRDLQIVMITQDAEGLKQQLVSDAVSTVKYEAEKPQALLDEDKVIGAMQLGIRADAVRIVPAEDVFRR